MSFFGSTGTIPVFLELLFALGRLKSFAFYCLIIEYFPFGEKNARLNLKAGSRFHWCCASHRDPFLALAHCIFLVFLGNVVSLWNSTAWAARTITIDWILIASGSAIRTIRIVSIVISVPSFWGIGFFRKRWTTHVLFLQAWQTVLASLIKRKQTTCEPAKRAFKAISHNFIIPRG